MNKNTILGIVILIAVVITGYIVVTKPAPQPINNQIGGAVTGPNSDSAIQTINGINYYYANVNMEGTTTSICRIKNLLNATSTILSFTAKTTSTSSASVNNGFNKAFFADLSTSTVALNGGNGSSSPAIVRYHSFAQTPDTFVWQPSATTTIGNSTFQGLVGINVDGSSNYYLRPGEDITLVVATGTPGVMVGPTGRCTAVLQQI